MAANRKSVREFVRERWAAAHSALFGKILRTGAATGETPAEAVALQTPPAETRSLRFRDIVREILAACAGAAVGAIAGQIVLPTLTPNLERWAFGVGITFGTPEFLTIASKEEIEVRETKVPAKNEWELNRIFCGIALYNTTKYCLMQPVVPAEGKKLQDWPLNRGKNSTVKALLIGDNGSHITVSWMSQEYGTGGWAHLGNRVGEDFVGYGIGCIAYSRDAEKGMPLPIKVLVGELTSEPVTDIKTFQRKMLDKMSESTMEIVIEKKGQEDCGQVQEAKKTR